MRDNLGGMGQRRVLFLGGSLNQTTMMHAVARELSEQRCHFAPFYADGVLRWAAEHGRLDSTILAGQAHRGTLDYLEREGLTIDWRGAGAPYDLVVAGTDLIVPRNLRGSPLVLIQEGMTDPEDWRYQLVRGLRLPRFLANTSMTGLSHAYTRFCVASEGYRDLFLRKGVRAATLVVTGLPNFDDVDAARVNDFPLRGYVLAATSCLRETWKPEDRRAFIRRAVEIAAGRALLFKLHPNEDWSRARREIERDAPRAQVFERGNTTHMVANCDVLVTRYSSVVLVAAALGKQIHSDLDPALLARLTPLQTGGRSAAHIADVCRAVLA
jgi:hypothetical protein